jgi:putative PIN family toxin of toxin-antitoxin system
MKIVLDTNVLVAGLLPLFGPCAEIVRMVSSSEITLCYDARILSEYSDVLRRSKFGFPQDKVDDILDQIEHCGRIFAPSPLTESLSDPDDDAFLEVALAGRVICLVTGNKRHFPTQSRKGVKVISPREYLDFLKTER